MMVVMTSLTEWLLSNVSFVWPFAPAARFIVGLWAAD
jgi:hypothetical protein